MKCLRKKPRRRYLTMNDVAENLSHSISKKAPPAKEIVSALVSATGMARDGKEILMPETLDRASGKGLRFIVLMIITAVVAVILILLLLFIRDVVLLGWVLPAVV